MMTKDYCKTSTYSGKDELERGAASPAGPVINRYKNVRIGLASLGAKSPFLWKKVP